MLNAGLALQFSDKIESALGLTATQQDRRQLQETIPKLSTVERTPRET
jgi:hypothetical protein